MGRKRFNCFGHLSLLPAHVHMKPALHLERRKEEASVRALMWDCRLRGVQRACQGREKQRERAKDGGVTWEDSRPATPGDSKETLNKDTS